MRERGMIFNAEMVRAILSGSKTQTRRIAEFKPRENQRLDNLALVSGYYCTGAPTSGFVLRSRGGSGGCWNDRTYPLQCPFGNVGDRIWVRETWAEAGAGAPELKLYRANYPEHVPSHYENITPVSDIRWTPSIHMPRWASRILLEIASVRLERLIDISEEDAQAEGVTPSQNPLTPPEALYRVGFANLWRDIYGEENWDSKPWVWVIEFKRVEASNEQ